MRLENGSGGYFLIVQTTLEESQNREKIAMAYWNYAHLDVPVVLAIASSNGLYRLFGEESYLPIARSAIDGGAQWVPIHIDEPHQIV